MSFLLAFLAGITFYNVVMPILDSVTNLVISMISTSTTKFNSIICQNQVNAELIQRAAETTNTSAIGFEVPSEESDYYDDGDECKSRNGRIGF